jgi:hypothetical protein
MVDFTTISVGGMHATGSALKCPALHKEGII